MKTNAYESAVIINAALDDEQIENIISRIKDFITNNGGDIRDVENWGRKRLAYMINKSKIGYYAVFRFNAPTNIISKLERNYTLDEHILRYLTISLDKDAVDFLEKKRSDSQSESEPVPEKGENRENVAVEKDVSK
ncbi:MAG TPA: 30S ribosomal protein S6 [Ignavibacteriaceae bacterium]|nr:30S ribosomal protein S6 [Ignavibacteriaceae bacterium]